MPLYVGDYLRDTQRLTTLQHGAYLLLLMDYWATQNPIPDDDAQLAAIVRQPLRSWRKIRPAIERFFTIADGRWTHKRVEMEIQKVIASRAMRVTSGRLGAESRWKNQKPDKTKTCDGSTDGNAIAHAMADAIGSPSVCYDFAITESESEEKKKILNPMNSVSIETGASAPARGLSGPEPALDLDKILFAEVKEICGRNAGGLAVKLRRMKDGDTAAALEIVEMARTKGDPKTWLAAVATGHGKEFWEYELAETKRMYKIWGVAT
jgi:uncharacterized protein YdaU (DUF1376 family)